MISEPGAIFARHGNTRGRPYIIKLKKYISLIKNEGQSTTRGAEKRTRYEIVMELFTGLKFLTVDEVCLAEWKNCLFGDYLIKSKQRTYHCEKIHLVRFPPRICDVIIFFLAVIIFLYFIFQIRRCNVMQLFKKKKSEI